MKICTKCHTQKSVTEFPKEQKRKDGLYPWCKPCLKEHRAARYIKRPRYIMIHNKVCSLCKEDKPRGQFREYAGSNLHYRCIKCEDKNVELKSNGLIECSSCKVIKEKSEFYPSKRDGHKKQCKDCSKLYFATNSERIRHYRLMKYYGISLAQYNELLKKQNYSCAICNRHQDEFKNSFAVDHAHVGKNQGLIRGLCCDTCNRFILWRHTEGLLLRKAADYLDGKGTGYYVPEEYLHGQKKKRRRK